MFFPISHHSDARGAPSSSPRPPPAPFPAADAAGVAAAAGAADLAPARAYLAAARRLDFRIDEGTAAFLESGGCRVQANLRGRERGLYGLGAFSRVPKLVQGSTRTGWGGGVVAWHWCPGSPASSSAD